jgi:hypothetical protein
LPQYLQYTTVIFVHLRLYIGDEFMKLPKTYDSTVIYGESGRKKTVPFRLTFLHASQKIVRVNNFFFRQKNTHHQAVIGVNTTYTSIRYTIFFFCGKGENISVLV